MQCRPSTFLPDPPFSALQSRCDAYYFSAIPTQVDTLYKWFKQIKRNVFFLFFFFLFQQLFGTLPSPRVTIRIPSLSHVSYIYIFPNYLHYPTSLSSPSLFFPSWLFFNLILHFSYSYFIFSFNLSSSLFNSRGLCHSALSLNNITIYSDYLHLLFSWTRGFLILVNVLLSLVLWHFSMDKKLKAYCSALHTEHVNAW